MPYLLWGLVVQKQKASQTRKTHKSRKTEPAVAPEQAKALAVIDQMALGGVTPPSSDPATAPPTPEQKASQTLDVLAPQEGDPKKQYWYRRPDSKIRKQVEKIMVMRAAGHDDKEIAKRLKTTPGTVQQNVYLARRNGWLDDNDEPIDLEAELAINIDRKVVRNINASLDGQMTNWQTHEMTLAAAKGRGMFKSGTSEGSSAPAQLPVVAIQVIMPAVGAQNQMQEIREDQMGGTPAYVEGEVSTE